MTITQILIWACWKEHLPHQQLQKPVMLSQTGGCRQSGDADNLLHMQAI